MHATQSFDYLTGLLNRGGELRMLFLRTAKPRTWVLKILAVCKCVGFAQLSKPSAKISSPRS
jgi:hypothetical protein